MSTKYDLLVIGSGPGGYVAAIRASQLGLKTAVVEKDKPGGVCLNIGCIPSKALIHQAAEYRAIDALTGLGCTVDTGGFDYSKVFKKSRQAADRLSKGVQFLLKKNKIDYIQGEGKLVAANECLVNEKDKITAKNILIATGSRPKQIPGFEFDEKQVLSSTGALLQEELPGSIIILGAGAIGMEFAHIMNAFGVEVTVLEMMDSVLPLEDKEVVDVLAKSCKKRKITLITGTKASSLEKSGGKVTLSLEGKESGELTADKLLVAVGRSRNTDGLGLADIGIKLQGDAVDTGDYYQTAVQGVYAVGDLLTSPQLAHLASKEGEIAVEHMAGEQPEPRVNLDLVPSAVYTEPEIASFGPNEKQAAERKMAYKTASFPYRGVGKAVATEQPDGMVKILYDPGTKEILGGHIVGANATDLIHELLLAKQAELLPEDIAGMIHAHPTLSEGIMEAARSVLGMAIHI